MAMVPVALSIDALIEARSSDLRNLGRFLNKHGILLETEPLQVLIKKFKESSIPDKSYLKELLKELISRRTVAGIPRLQDWDLSQGDDGPSVWQLIAVICSHDEIRESGQKLPPNGVIECGRWRAGEIPDLYSMEFSTFSEDVSTGEIWGTDRRKVFGEKILGPLNSVAKEVRILDNYFHQKLLESSVEGGSRWLIDTFLNVESGLSRRVRVYSVAEYDQMGPEDSHARGQWVEQTSSLYGAIFEQTAGNGGCHLDVYILPKQHGRNLNHQRWMQFAISDKTWTSVSCDDSADLFDLHSSRPLGSWTLDSKTDVNKRYRQVGETWERHDFVEAFHFPNE